MGGSSSSSSSTQKTDNSRTTKIQDRRAGAQDNGIAIGGENNTVDVESLDPKVAKAALDFATESQQGFKEGLQDTTKAAVEVASEQATDDAKEIVSQFGRYGLLAGVAVTAIIFIWGER